ncbi:P-loop containing nucleoside triphosphate hydrolase protein, partial [Dioscorea alata]
VVDMDQRTNQLMIDFSRCCVTGCCSLNIYSRLNASQKATKLKKEIDELMKGKIHLSVLVKRRLSNPIIDMPISTTNVGIKIGSNLCDVCNWLAVERVGIIGIYGMGGVGKSTLLKEIRRSKDVLNMGFDYIIHARASYELHAEDLRDFLGIPDPHDESYVTTTPYKQKVVFTTRSKKVCDCMKADKKIKLECLDKDEGWQLFKENLAMDLEGKPFIEEAAREVVNLCGGLPLALIMVGRAMSNKTTTTKWNLILDQLLGRLFSSLCESMFLYLKGFGLISCFDSFSEAYMHGCYILEILEEASLVVTHDNKRVAKWIAIGVGGGIHKPWFEVERWVQLEQVSIVNCDMNCLPKLQFECSSLLSLNIQHNQRLEYLPKIFLRQMPNLTYLNLSSTGIHKLPNESITHLFNLEFLDISRTKIKSLPHEMGNLKKLKYIFYGYLFLGKLQAGLLSNLYRLQVLDLYPYGYVELKELEILRGLKEIEGLQTIQLSSLTSEGHGWPKEFQIRSRTTVQNLVITNGININLKFLKLFDLPKLENLLWKIEPKNVFPMLQLVQIEACHTLTSLHWVLHLPLLRAMKHGHGYELVDEEMGEIEEDNTITMFPRLKHLTIVHLPKLLKISSCALDFPHLSKVHLEDCPNLKGLPFKPDIINNQGLLIKCEKKWWELLEWDDPTIQSQFCSNSTEEEEIAEFFGIFQNHGLSHFSFDFRLVVCVAN